MALKKNLFYLATILCTVHAIIAMDHEKVSQRVMLFIHQGELNEEGILLGLSPGPRGHIPTKMGKSISPEGSVDNAGHNQTNNDNHLIQKKGFTIVYKTLGEVLSFLEEATQEEQLGSDKFEEMLNKHIDYEQKIIEVLQEESISVTELCQLLKTSVIFDLNEPTTRARLITEAQKEIKITQIAVLLNQLNTM